MKTAATTPTPHPERHNQGQQHRSRFIFLEIASYKRCSRPLCSSQTTTPYHTPHTRKRACSMQPGNQKHKSHTTTPGHIPPQGNPTGHDAMVLLPQDPTVCQTLNRLLPRRTVPGPPPPQKGASNPYWAPQNNTRPLFADIPPVSTRRRTSVCATGVLLTTPPHPHTRGKVIVGAP